MAVDEYLLINHRKTGVPSLSFYTWEPSAATIGRNQSLHEELDIAFCKKHSIDYTRRITGGGAVLHSNTGEITYSIICSTQILRQAYSRLKSFYQPLAEKMTLYYVPILYALSLGLNDFGLNIDISKLNCPALFLDGKKISGNAQLIRGTSVLQHGTLLLDVEPEFMYKVLKVPQGKTRTNIVRSVKAKVTGITSHLLKNSPMDPENPEEMHTFEETLVNSLKNAFEKTLKIEFTPQPLTESELITIKKIAHDKYSNSAWRFKK